MTTYIYFLPFPPSVDTAFPGKARRYKSDAYKAFQTHCHVLLYRQSAVRGISAPLRCTIDLYRPDNRRRDVANYEKCTSDTLVAHGVMLDDSQIVDNRQRWAVRPQDAPEWAGCRVTIDTLEDDYA